MPPPDVDNDGDIDQYDLGFMMVCVGGSELPIHGLPGCETTDLNGDDDVDTDDFGMLHRCISGTLPADSNCLN